MSKTHDFFKLCLLGNFYAHTNVVSDFTGIDDHICNYFHLDKITRNGFSTNFSKQFNISVTRFNKDKKLIFI